MLFKKEANKLAALLEIKEGRVVGDIGAGKGDFSVAFSKLAGDSGKIYAIENDSERLGIIKRKIEKYKLRNILVLQSTETSISVPPFSLDAALVRVVYHHFSNPQDINQSLFAALKPGGKLLVIDFAPSFLFSLVSPVKDVPKNRGGHGIPKEILIEELTRAGFKLIHGPKKWTWTRYCILFEKPLG